VTSHTTPFLASSGCAWHKSMVLPQHVHLLTKNAIAL
jgi:hypothetical protein